MDFDNIEQIKRVDPEDMLGHIQGLPEQLQNAWLLGMDLPLKQNKKPGAVVISGMGGSAIGSDLLSAYVAAHCPVPVIVNRDYDLPAWVSGESVLVIASSHSGNTEETLSAYAQAEERGCHLMSVSTGGAIKQKAIDAGADYWIFKHDGMPRAAVGYSFGLLLALFCRLGLFPDAAKSVSSTVELMKQIQENYQPEISKTMNPAKHFAEKLFGQWVTIIGSGYLAPVARRWKGQINELAKAWAQFEFLPEADHNTLAGSKYPKELLQQMAVVFLTAASDHSRNQKRSKLTSDVLSGEKISTLSVSAQGVTPLDHIWTSLLYGDYVSYYLSMLYEVDPTPIEALQSFKQMMKK